MMATVLSRSMHLERYIREHTHVYDIGPLQLARLQQRLHFWLASEATLLIPGALPGAPLVEHFCSNAGN